jgi:site-specific recombinase XerD
MRTSSKPPRRSLELQISPPRSDLRHTFATLILEEGENPKVVQ